MTRNTEHEFLVGSFVYQFVELRYITHGFVAYPPDDIPLPDPSGGSRPSGIHCRNDHLSRFVPKGEPFPNLVSERHDGEAGQAGDP